MWKNVGARWELSTETSSGVVEASPRGDDGAMNETHARDAYILIAAHDPARADILHIAAATGREVVEATDDVEIRRLFRRAFAVLIDATCAPAVTDLPRRPRVFLVAPDPGPPDFELAMGIHAELACTVPSMSYDIVEALSRQPENTTGGGEVIGVMGACGGAGTSTLACALALTSSRPSLLVDACPYSGGLDLVLGAEEKDGKRWPDVHVDGHVPAAELRGALPEVGGSASLLTCDRGGVSPPPTTDEIVAVIESHRADPTGARTIVDLPTWSEPVAGLLGVLDRLILVVPAEVRAVAAAASLTRVIRTELSIAVRYRQWSGLSAREVGRLLSLPVDADIPHLKGLAKQVETRGLTSLPTRLRRVAECLLGEKRG